jgi:hypothetical protein
MSCFSGSLNHCADLTKEEETEEEENINPLCREKMGLTMIF